MNKESKKFLLLSILIFIIPSIVGTLIINKRVADNLLKIPVDVKDVAFEYINNKTNVSKSNPVKIYDYEKNMLNNSLVYKLSFVKNNESNNEIIVQTLSIENNENQYLVKEYNQIIFKNNYIVKYSFLLISIGLLVLCLYTSAICFGTTTKHKWGRSLFILCGVGTLSLNWTTGLLDFSLISMAIPSAGIEFGGTYPAYGLVSHLPLGVIIYWIKWNKEDKRRNVSNPKAELNNSILPSNI